MKKIKILSGMTVVFIMFCLCCSLFTDKTKDEFSSTKTTSTTTSTTTTTAYNYFAFVPNKTSNNISVYSINTSTGVLSQVNGSPFAAGTGPTSVAIHPTGKFAYAVNYDSNSITAYSINANNGFLTVISGSPIAAGTNPTYVTIHPTGNYCYVSSYMSLTSGYSINSSSGMLTEISGSPFAGTGSCRYKSLFNSSGNLCFESESGMRVKSFLVNPGTGSLTLAKTYQVGAYTSLIAINPLSKFIYVLDDHNQMNVYSIDNGNGILTEISGSPFFNIMDAGNDRFFDGIAIDAASNYMYVTDYNHFDGNKHYLQAFSLNNNTGSITKITGSALLTGVSKEFTVYDTVNIDPTGAFLYVANFGSNNIAAYKIDSGSGLPSPLSGVSTFATGTGPASITTAKIPK